MKWQQRVQVTTGLTCWQIMLHFMVVVALLTGWKTKALIPVGVGLCLLYVATVIAMFALQRFHSGKLRNIGDFLEELTTTWYFGSAMIALWLLSRVVESNLLIAAAGLVMIAGPAVYSLLAKDKSGNFAAKHPVRR
ncbi:YbhQ family protein [Enterobacteriaceae bacterium H20N1]|uniref:YbhQ family protein n=1 Tax=Dryocola boscaweniae TaxID=2925397 RepID=A0A9X2W653_9ENTR|nr:YbhQ family protein [Dryocola boscaweniae]MCT4701267.1 YbhQ family protein [Dryocola boscaweniae]MCT4718498.1 YbhQ family protein [Dryocola boscaweniae]